MPVIATVTVAGNVAAENVFGVKLTAASVACTGGRMPLPPSVTVCGLPDALSVKDKLALSVLVADGVNDTCSVTLLLGATVIGADGGLTSLKSPASAPANEGRALMTRLALPLLLIVTDSVFVVAGLTRTLPKLSGVGEALKLAL